LGCPEPVGHRFMRHEHWSDALFLSYPLPPEALQRLLPDGLVPDVFRGKAWVSIVALTEEGIRPAPPASLPGGSCGLWEYLRVSHYAVNVRAYVKPAGGEPARGGIYFFSLDCSAVAPTLGAQALFNLRYRVSKMARPGPHTMRNARVEGGKKVEFVASWAPGDEVQGADKELAEFICERYSLYNEGPCGMHPLSRKLGRVWRGDIVHSPWVVQRCACEVERNTMLLPSGLDALVDKTAVQAHASAGVGYVDFFLTGRV